MNAFIHSGIVFRLTLNEWDIVAKVARAKLCKHLLFYGRKHQMFEGWFSTVKCISWLQY